MMGLSGIDSGSMWGVKMWGMGIVCLLFIALTVLSIATPLKYLRRP